jgi:uncharacterized protein (TIGR02391 family)
MVSQERNPSYELGGRRRDDSSRYVGRNERSALRRPRRAASRVSAGERFYQQLALNGLVRLRSGLEFDGTTLMERAFSPTSPVLKFNELRDQSDKDEQKGFMQMFSGAVSGLRNPRAHKFIQDDPERALEFIAFVSLLAKLLDEASGPH